MFFGNEHIKNTVDKMFENQLFDNLIIQGNESTGKTTFVNYVINKLQNKHSFLHLHFLEDKGIDVIRNKIKYFTELKHKKMKFIIIDDADDLSTSAQQSLRRIMEEKKKTSTFIFTVKNFKHLIFPIHSRCLLFRLNANLDKETIHKLLLNKYKNRYDPSVIENVSKMYDYNIMEINKNIQKFETRKGVPMKDGVINTIFNNEGPLDVKSIVNTLHKNPSTVKSNISEIIQKLKNRTKIENPKLYHHYYVIYPSIYNIIKPFVI